MTTLMMADSRLPALMKASNGFFFIEPTIESFVAPLDTALKRLYIDRLQNVTRRKTILHESMNKI